MIQKLFLYSYKTYSGNFIDYKQLQFWRYWEVPQQNEDFLQSKDDLLETAIPPGSAYVMI